MKVYSHPLPAKVIANTDIPFSRSGKIVELALHNVVQDRSVGNKDVLSDPEALDMFCELVEMSALLR